MSIPLSEDRYQPGVLLYPQLDEQVSWSIWEVSMVLSRLLIFSNKIFMCKTDPSRASLVKGLSPKPPLLPRGILGGTEKAANLSRVVQGTWVFSHLKQSPNQPPWPTIHSSQRVFNARYGRHSHTWVSNPPPHMGGYLFSFQKSSLFLSVH